MENSKVKIESTVPGLVYPTWRDKFLKTSYGYIEGRRKVDGAEGLWRINNSLYNLERFAKNHPGGAEWIRITKGTDITELFMSHHLTDNALKLLPKYYVKEVTTPRSVPFTFKEDGFYHTFRKRAKEALKDVDFHHSSVKSNIFADLFATFTLLGCIAAASTQSYLIMLLAGIFLTGTTIIAHNFFHMRNNFRMYYFDLSTMSSKDWRITHAMSHHVYPNTLWDYEVYTAEPLLEWLPFKNKTFFSILRSQFLSPVFWSLLFVEQLIKRYYTVFFEFGTFEFRDVVPFFLPTLMMFFAPSISTALTVWLTILIVASFFFGVIGFNAAHHHPNIFHDGDIYRHDFDWGLLELDATRDRNVIDDIDLLVLTNFGQHGLHHLLPTVDHSYLRLCLEPFYQTCKEFGISVEKYSQWELIKGQFKQLARVELKKNQR